jgi:Methyltransferase domain
MPRRISKLSEEGPVNGKARLGRAVRQVVGAAGRLPFVQEILEQSRPRIVDITNNDVRWIQYANAGMLNPGNLYCFDYAIKNLPDEAPILEIGSFCGLSANVLTYYKKANGRGNRLITCENWSFAGARPGEGFPESFLDLQEYRRVVKDSLVRNARLFSKDDLPYTVELSSSDFFEAWGRAQVVADVHGRQLTLGGTLSLCYVDGGHDYASVKRDFESCAQYLSPGGFILFDDSSDDSGFDGVRQLVREVQSHGSFQLVLKNPNYLFRKE